jgi:transcriptional regulator with XRE-family HTH domain
MWRGDSSVTLERKERKVRHRPSVVTDHQAYLHSLMAELDRAAISLRLGQALQEAGITQQEMAELLHVHKRSVEDYVSPKITTVPFDRLDEWARIARTTKEWLLHGDQPEPATVEEIRQLRSDVAELRAQVERVLELLLPGEDAPRASSRPS